MELAIREGRTLADHRVLTMGSPTTVVAATDFSEGAARAAHRAALLAMQLRMSLSLLHVVDRPLLARLCHRFAAQEQDERVPRGSAARALEEQAAELQASIGASERPTLHPRVAIGNTHDELLACGSTAALTVLGAHGDRPQRDPLFGSIAERLLRSARNPVLVVRRAPAGPDRRVLVPSDFSPASAAAFDLVERFAPGAAVTVIHAFDVPFEGKLRFAGVPEAAIEVHRERAHHDALARLASLEERIKGSRLPSIVELQDPVRLILDAEKIREADLIVIGRAGQSFVHEALLGSVARRVLADSQCDVLVATLRGVTDGVAAASAVAGAARMD
jgi:nucleotide-binding universal stress UspA family protein